MKTVGLVGSCAIVALLLGFLGLNVWADEGEQAPAIAESVVKSPLTCRCEGDLVSSVAKIKQVLAEPLKSTGLKFTKEPLENIVNFLQSEYGIPILLDEPALEDAGLTRDEPVDVNLQHISLRSALRLLLKTKQLTYVIRDEVLIITTPEEADDELMTCVYDVRDLVGKGRDDREIKALVDVIVSCVARETWAIKKGGVAEIKSLRPGLLVISQTRAVHEEISDLLALIRETQRQPSNPPAGEETGMMDRRGYGMSRGGMEGMRGGYGDTFGGRGRETGAEPTPAVADPFD